MSGLARTIVRTWYEAHGWDASDDANEVFSDANLAIGETVAEAVLAHLRAVAADEGVRGEVALQLLHTPEWDDPPRGFPVVRAGCAERAAKVAIDALLDHLDHLGER